MAERKLFGRLPKVIVFRKNRDGKFYWTLNSYSCDCLSHAYHDCGLYLAEHVKDEITFYGRRSPGCDIERFYFKYNSKSFNNLRDCLLDAKETILDDRCYNQGYINDEWFGIDHLQIQDYEGYCFENF